jgi:YD repeat-containing protein
MRYFVIVLFSFFSLGAGAQNSSGWKISKLTETGKPTYQYLYDKLGRLTTVKENGKTEKNLLYDATGRVKLILVFQKNKLLSVDSNFTYTADGKRASFDRIFPGYSTDKFSYVYDDKGRITKRRIDKYRINSKAGSAPPWEELTYSYSGNKITLEKKETSFGGVIGYKHEYTIDENGNITALTESGYETDSPDHVISNYDSKPRLQLPDEWIDNTFPQSVNNYSRYQWNEKRYQTYTYTYNKDGLVSGYTSFYQGNDLTVTRKAIITYIK